MPVAARGAVLADDRPQTPRPHVAADVVDLDADAKLLSSRTSVRALNREPFIEGIILKSESKKLGVTETKKVTSLKENKVPDSIFLVPAGYKKQ